MANLLSRLRNRLGGDHGRVVKQANPPRPETPVVVIGDIHGRADLVDRLLGKIATQAPEATVLFVGDYIDRGPDSRAVLDRMLAFGHRAIYLKGNHEVMLLDFLDDPIERGARWLRHGGVQTLESYGINMVDNPDQAMVMAARDGLRQALSDGAETWLRALPIYWQSGNLLVCHAGPDPAVGIHLQSERDFLWGHRRFLRDPRGDGLWVAHGHWSRSHVIIKDGRIGVDTGAWESGNLSAVLIQPEGQIEIIESR